MVTGEDLFLINTSVLRRVFGPKNGILAPKEELFRRFGVPNRRRKRERWAK